MLQMAWARYRCVDGIAANPVRCLRQGGDPSQFAVPGTLAEAQLEAARVPPMHYRDNPQHLAGHQIYALVLRSPTGLILLRR